MTRRHELDALRGIFLLLMAATHLPTVLNSYADQPLGYASAAEGFVFLSAFLVGSIYTPLISERGMCYVRGRLWRRARKLYGYHLLLLVFFFTVVAGAAVMTDRPALHNYALIFFRHPGWALAASPVLLYQPPLLDILPMYIVFLALSPWLLKFARRGGWGAILSGSGLVWLFAQLGGGRLLYGLLAAGGLPLPRDALGAFNWFGWQLVWIAGLWLGFGQHRRAQGNLMARRSSRAIVMAAASATAILFLLWRHHVAGFLTDVGGGSLLLDKWKLGPLRVIDCIAVGWLLNALLLPVLNWLRVRVLELLGRNSLQVFSAHIPVCVLGDGLIRRGGRPPTGLEQAVLVAVMLAVMLWVAWRSDGNSGKVPRVRAARLRSWSQISPATARAESRRAPWPSRPAETQEPPIDRLS